MSSINNLYSELQELFASNNWVMTQQQVDEQSVSMAVQVAVFYGDIKKVGETYHWVTK